MLASLSKPEQAKLKWDWSFWARPSQRIPPGSWNTWMILAGRGFGKTRVGSETIRSLVCGDTPLSKGSISRIALIAETAADARDVMVCGESGILACHPPEFRPTYQPTNRKLEWPNGAVAYLYNATTPDQLRGPQHDFAWLDELAKFEYIQETWDQCQFGLRLGEHPRSIVTTTPRPLPLIKKLLNDRRTFVTRGSTFDNSSNLAQPFLDSIHEKYSGTRLGRQELEGEILTDIPGALFRREDIDQHRVRPDTLPDLERIVVAVDPAVSNNEDSDETGIVVVGIARDSDGYHHGYVLNDASLKGSPEEWARKTVQKYREYSADRVIAEKNQGGLMVESTLKSVDRNLPLTLVHASRGKTVRAEPISALYEQGRIHHVGSFDKLEDQMCLFSADNRIGSPDRVDALVWGLTSLFDKIVGRPRKVSTPLVESSDGFTPSFSHSSLHNNPQGWMA